MLIVEADRPQTPYAWCRHAGASPGDSVVMTESAGRSSVFVIERIEEGKVWWTLEGVFRDVEWRGLDGESQYVLHKRKGER